MTDDVEVVARADDEGRIIAYKTPAGLTGNWRARKVRYGAWVLEVDLPCVNGLPAWFSIATFHAAEDAERLMTDGARQEAGEYAAKFADAINSVRKGATYFGRSADPGRKAMEEALQLVQAELRRVRPNIYGALSHIDTALSRSRGGEK